MDVLCREVLDAMENVLPVMRNDETPMDNSELKWIDSNTLLKALSLAMMLTKNLQSKGILPFFLWKGTILEAF